MTRASERLSADERTGANGPLLSQVLSNSSAELMRLVQMVRDIETAIFDGKASLHAEVGQSAALHNLDFVIQTLDELSDVFLRLARALPDDVTVDEFGVLGPVRLAVLRHALARTGQSAAVNEALLVERIELF